MKCFGGMQQHSMCSYGDFSPAERASACVLFPGGSAGCASMQKNDAEDGGFPFREMSG
jgi:hypothetical protein